MFNFAIILSRLNYNTLAQAAKKKILVAEDDLAMREIAVHKLLSLGFDVKEAEDGKQALELIASFRPDLILLDLMMPEVDGFGVLEALRNNPDKVLSQIPVIVLSNLWSNEDILKAKDYAVADYLVKAYFTPEEISAKVTAVLEGKNKKL